MNPELSEPHNPFLSHRDLRVLVCTANLGNARPDKNSISALVPKDGCLSEVTSNPKFPLPTTDFHESLLKEIGYGKQASRRHACIPMIHYEHDEVEVEFDDDHFDIIVLGLQEATFEVENDDPILPAMIQPILSKTFFKAIHTGAGRAIQTGAGMMKSRDYTQHNVVADWLDAKDSKVLGKLLQERCPSYNFAVRFQRGEMRLEILTRKTLLAEAISVKAQNTGIGMNGIMNAANKGGIIAELLINRSTRLTFCTAHLQAHEGKDRYLERCRMTAAILEGTTPSDPPLGVDLALRSHVTFFLGDLNFRTELPKSENLPKEEHIKEVLKLVEAEDWYALNKADELFKALRDNDCLAGFKTLPCIFPPTFKVERSGKLIYKDQRRPSYTDRILWRTLHKMDENVKPLAYEPVLDFTTSDHKPVRGAFEIKLNDRIQPRRPKERRRMTVSTRDLFAGTTKRMGGTSDSKLNLFIGNIRCSLKKRAMAPDPYVVFMSFPQALVQQPVKRFARFKNTFRQRMAAEKVAGSTTKDIINNVDALGFPRTKKVRGTYTPQWLDDICLVVETHEKEGKPLNMTGSILHVVVMDKAPTIESRVIGTFPFNLAKLCVSTQEDHEETEPASVQPGSADRRGKWRKASTLRNVFAGAGGSSDEFHLCPDDRVINIKQPLIRCGKETGWISLTFDAKWLTDYHASKERSRRQSLGRVESNARSLNSSSQGEHLSLGDDDYSRASGRSGLASPTRKVSSRSANERQFAANNASVNGIALMPEMNLSASKKKQHKDSGHEKIGIKV